MNVAAGFRGATETVGTGLASAPSLVRAQGQHKVHGTSIIMGGVTVACVYYLQVSPVAGEPGYQEDNILLDARDALIAGAVGALITYVGLTTTGWVIGRSESLGDAVRGPGEAPSLDNRMGLQESQGADALRGTSTWEQIDPMASPDRMRQRASVLSAAISARTDVNPNLRLHLASVATGGCDRSESGGLATSDGDRRDISALISPVCVCIGGPVHWGDVVAAELIGGYSSPIPRVRQNEISIRLGGANPQNPADWHRLSRGLQIELVRRCMIWAPRTAESFGVGSPFYYYLRAGSTECRITATGMARFGGMRKIYKDEDEQRRIIHMLQVMSSDTAWYNLSEDDQRWLLETWNVGEPDLPLIPVVLDLTDHHGVRTGLGKLLARVTMVLNGIPSENSRLVELMHEHNITATTLDRVIELGEDEMVAMVTFVVVNRAGLEAIGKYIRVQITVQGQIDNHYVRDKCLSSRLSPYSPHITPIEAASWILHERSHGAAEVEINAIQEQTMADMVKLLDGSTATSQLCTRSVIAPVLNDWINSRTLEDCRVPVKRITLAGTSSSGRYRYSNGLAVGLDYVAIEGLSTDANSLEVKVHMNTGSPDGERIMTLRLSPRHLDELVGKFHQRHFPPELRSPGHAQDPAALLVSDIHFNVFRQFDPQAQRPVVEVVAAVCQSLQVHHSLCTCSEEEGVNTPMTIVRLDCTNVHPRVAVHIDRMLRTGAGLGEGYGELDTGEFDRVMDGFEGLAKTVPDHRIALNATREAQERLHAIADLRGIGDGAAEGDDGEGEEY